MAKRKTSKKKAASKKRSATKKRPAKKKASAAQKKKQASSAKKKASLPKSLAAPAGIPAADEDGPVGILAGAGELPWIAMREALRRGVDIRAMCFTDDPPPADLAHLTERIILTKFYSSTLAAFRSRGIRRILLLGKSTRDILYNKPRFDARTLLLLARMVSQSDYAIFEFLAGVVEKEGFTIIPQDTYLSHLFIPEGRYGAKLSKKQIADVRFGLEMAQSINRLDIGQSVVVGDHAVLAVEAAEGTDRCIRRGGELFRKGGAVVCKLSKENHDRRFDIPVTGAHTLGIMAETRCAVLAFDPAHTFVLNPAEFLEDARRKGITVVATSRERALTDERYLASLNSAGGGL